MSEFNRLMRDVARSRDIARAQQRDAKRKLFEVELIEQVDFDESEVFDLAEARERYAIAH